jgi:hypothetical protein
MTSHTKHILSRNRFTEKVNKFQDKTLSSLFSPLLNLNLPVQTERSERQESSTSINPYPKELIKFTRPLA